MLARSFLLALPFFLANSILLTACAEPVPADASKQRPGERDDEKASGDEPAEGSAEADLTAEEGREGGPCRGADTCNPGLFCSPRGTCQRLGAEGAACAAHADCRAELSCNRASGRAGACTAPRGEEGDRCGGVIETECKKGLSCRRDEATLAATEICAEKDDDRPTTHYCEQLSRCCGRLPGLVQRLTCGGTVAAGNEKACGVAIAVCQGGGI
jgi:hypothetical protein